MNNYLKRFVTFALVFAMLFTTAFGLLACKPNDPDDPDNPTPGKTISNESTRLVLSTSELDGVFNPFYSSSAPDGSIVGMTQLSMLSADKNGKIVGYTDAANRRALLAADACVVADYEEVSYVAQQNNAVTGEVLDQKYTRYRFVLKTDIKFSNGSPLTMKDVLFNLYEYLDPAYYGSATIYSTDILGLKEYQTQTRNENEQDSFNKKYDELADIRIDYLKDCVKDIKEDNKVSLTDEQMESFLKEYADLGGYYKDVLNDYRTAKQYFRKELETDYNNSVGTAQDIKYVLKDGVTEVNLTTDTEAFLFNGGFITWNDDVAEDEDYHFDYSFGAASKNWTKEEAIQKIYDNFVPNDITTVVTEFGTSNDLKTYIANLLKKEYFDSIGDSDKIPSVSGIRFINRDEEVTVNNTVYGVPAYDSTGAVTSGAEVLEIIIKDIDPKAIWNFSFTVAPMYYYSDEEHIKKFDYVSNFGIERGDPDFQDDVIKNPDKIGVPVGAGPYKATTQSGDSSKVSAGTFRSNGVVYFERNEHFMFPAKIKYVNYQVVSTNLMLQTLYSGDVHFVEPSCRQEIIDDIQSNINAGKKIGYNKVMTNGYGYIGINAEKVPNIAVRRAIMHAINTQSCVDYYMGYSSPIYRPMTKASWAYPDAVDSLHAGGDKSDEHYYYFDETGETSKKLVEEAGYTLNGKNVLANGSDVLQYDFTIAGETTDHPAFTALKRASEILNKIGFKITVKNDSKALSKLNSGDLTVWAAAWGAAVDPDMYQVYHKDSTAGSTSNWGYRAILKNQNGKYATELGIVTELSELIDFARETNDQAEREERYYDALNLVMDLAVELPAYQRSDLFAFNTEYIDANTLQKDLTAYNGPLSRLWEVSLNETK